MKKEVKMLDFVNVIVNESIAFLNNKYKIDRYNVFFDKKNYWEIQKPRFDFDVYPDSKVDNTLWVMDFFYFKIRRFR